EAGVAVEKHHVEKRCAVAWIIEIFLAERRNMLALPGEATIGRVQDDLVVSHRPCVVANRVDCGQRGSGWHAFDLAPVPARFRYQDRATRTHRNGALAVPGESRQQ